MLREEWGFEGLVVSDWGAVHDRVPALAAGLDLEMPPNPRSDDQVVAAVRAGELDEAVLDARRAPVLELVARAWPSSTWTRTSTSTPTTRWPAAAAVGGAAEERGRDPAARRPRAIAVIGEFARTPRYQGAGSSQVNPTRVDARARRAAAAFGEVTVRRRVRYRGAVRRRRGAAGRGRGGRGAPADRGHAFLGLPGPDESEGFDRTHLELPANQVALLEAVAAVNPRGRGARQRLGGAVSTWHQARRGRSSRLARRPGGGGGRRRLLLGG